MKIKGVAGVSAAISAAGVYRKMKEPARQNSPFRRAWENHLLRSLDVLDTAVRAGLPMPFVYVALGDSAAQGIGAAQISEGYVPRIAAGLEQVVDRDVVLLNLSMSGATTESVLMTQLPQLEGIRIGGRALTPDLVTLDIGGNDVGLSRLTFDQFDDLAGRVTERLPQPAFVANIPTFKPLKTEQRAAEFSQALGNRAVAAGASLVDLQTVSENMSLAKYMTGYHAPDLFHPNTPWYHRWSQMFMDAISERLGLPSVNMDEVPEWSGAPGLEVR